MVELIEFLEELEEVAMLKINKRVTKRHEVTVLKLRISGELAAGSPAAAFKCSACGGKLGARRFGTAWIRDGGSERSMRLCWDCVEAALHGCEDVADSG